MSQLTGIPVELLPAEGPLAWTLPPRPTTLSVPDPRIPRPMSTPKRRPNYWDYIRVDDLLTLQSGLEDDESTGT